MKPYALPGRDGGGSAPARWWAPSLSATGPSWDAASITNRNPPTPKSGRCAKPAIGPGATLYVNLEPCSHYGRTPPCTEAIIAAGIQRVVASIRDPNPQVNGRGFARLRAAGIEVLTDVLPVEGTQLNEVFIINQLERRPFVHLKLATSLDGRIATRTGASQWVTGAAARAAGQELRHRYDAIAVGTGTVLADNPQLTDRTGQYRHRPLVRVVFDSARVRLPLTAHLVQTARVCPTWLVTVVSPQRLEDLSRLEQYGVRIMWKPMPRAVHSYRRR